MVEGEAGRDGIGRAGKAPGGGCGEFGEGDWGEEEAFQGFIGKNRGCAFAEGMSAISAKRTAAHDVWLPLQIATANVASGKVSGPCL